MYVVYPKDSEIHAEGERERVKGERNSNQLNE